MAIVTISSGGSYYVNDGDTVIFSGDFNNSSVYVYKASGDPAAAADVNVIFENTIQNLGSVTLTNSLIADVTVKSGANLVGGVINVDAPDTTTAINFHVEDNVQMGDVAFLPSNNTTATLTTGSNVVWGEPGPNDGFSINAQFYYYSGSTLSINLGPDNTFLTQGMVPNQNLNSVIDISGLTVNTDPTGFNAPALQLGGHGFQNLGGVTRITANDMNVTASYIRSGNGDEEVTIKGLVHNVHGAIDAGTLDTTYGQINMGYGDDILHLGGDIVTNDLNYIVRGEAGDDHLDFQFINAAQKQEFINAFIAAGGTYDATTDTFGDATGLTWSISQPDGTGTIQFDMWESVELNPICFTRGTRIATLNGLIPVEDLEEGDLVLTRDHGYQPIRWIGSRRFTAVDQPLRENLCPVLIEAGALGKNIPERDLLVSRQHRILLHSDAGCLLTGEKDMLIAAVKLTDLPGVSLQRDVQSVEYFHILFDEHQLIFAENAVAESLLLGDQALKTLTHEAREEIQVIFPEIADADFNAIAAAPLYPGEMQRKIVSQHLYNEYMPA